MEKMKSELDTLVKLIDGATSEEVETVIELYSEGIIAFVKNILLNKRLIADFVISNKALFLTLINAVCGVVGIFISLIPQLELFFEKVEKLSDEMSLNSFSEDIEKINKKASRFEEDIKTRIGLNPENVTETDNDEDLSDEDKEDKSEPVKDKKPKKTK